MDNLKKIARKIVLYILALFILLSFLGVKIGIVVFCVIAIVMINKYFKNNSMGKIIDAGSAGGPRIKKIVLFFCLVVFSLWLFFASIVIIDAGEVGVYSLFGKVRDQELYSGFHLVIPLARITKMSVRTEEYTMSVVSGEGRKTGDDSILALTKEGLQVSLDITALYHLVPVQASNVYRTIGLDYDEKIIRPEIRSTIREVVSMYTAQEVYSEKREEANTKIQDRLRASLEKRGIALEDVLLRNVNLPENLAKSIQEKLQAEQEVQKYEFLLGREKKEKERKIIEAQGQRDSQKIINESLTPNYLYYSYINSLEDRQGTIYVPTNPANGLPLFNNLGK